MTEKKMFGGLAEDAACQIARRAIARLLRRGKRPEAQLAPRTLSQREGEEPQRVFLLGRDAGQIVNHVLYFVEGLSGSHEVRYSVAVGNEPCVASTHCRGTISPTPPLAFRVSAQCLSGAADYTVELTPTVFGEVTSTHATGLVTCAGFCKSLPRRCCFATRLSAGRARGTPPVGSAGKAPELDLTSLRIRLGGHGAAELGQQLLDSRRRDL